MNPADIWTVEDPPAWMALMEAGVVARGPTTITLCWAIPPDAIVQRVAYWPGLRHDAQPTDPLPKLIEVSFLVDHEKRRLHSPRTIGGAA